MLNLPDIDPLPINQLARAIGKNLATIYRWSSARGVRGQRLRLTRIGGRTYVRRQDLDAFLAALNGPALPDARAERADAARMDLELDAAGL